MGRPGSRALFDRAQAKVTTLAPTAVEKHYPTQMIVSPLILLGRRLVTRLSTPKCQPGRDELWTGRRSYL